MCIRTLFKLIKDVYVLYKVAFYEFFWQFMYLFINRKSKPIHNENILITGTGSGIGKNLAVKLAKMGNTIVCVDINGEANDQTVREIIQDGGRAYGFQCNVAIYDNVKELHSKTLEEVGRVSYLFNVAGVVSGKLFRELDPKSMKLTMDVNVLSVFWLTQLYLEDMVELGKGHITTISSVAGLFGTPKLVDYCASKFAVMGFVEALRMECQADNLPVDFTVVNPYFIRTGMFDGAVSKWPYFMPILETDYVGDMIIQAVQHNRVIMIMPRMFYYLMLVKAFCPDRLTQSVNKFCGTFDVMNTFRGRVADTDADPQSQKNK